MNYMKITKDDMNNGEGFRTTLWVSGCNHKCPNCHNPETWNKNAGSLFDNKVGQELFTELAKPYIKGLSISGGDPLFPDNRQAIEFLCKQVKLLFPNKTIWLWTGYLWEEIKDLEVIKYIDVLIDGPFIEELKSKNLKWKGSTNQRVIDVQETIKQNKIVIHREKKTDSK